MQIENKTIIVTGASSGIGAAAAKLFARQGANVVLGARRETLLKNLAEEIRNSNGKAITLAGDVRKESYAADLVMLAKQEFGGLDGAFNNAGIIGDMGPIPEMQTSTWDDVIATNLSSAFFASKYQIPAIKSQGGGSIVFTSSFVGNTNGGMPGMGAYAASKAGMVGLTKSLAAEHGPDGVRVNAILPGGTQTEMAPDDRDTQDFIAGLHALKRMAQPEEIAQAALYLLSDQSSFMSGSAMLVDGGLSAQLAS